MWFPRVKIRITNKISNDCYQVNKWKYIKKFKTKKLYYRYLKDNYIEFVIDGYKNKQEALKKGKILFSNVLFYGYKSAFSFEMGDNQYITTLFKEKNGYSGQDFYKNEEWFFNTKMDSADFIGFAVFEAVDLEDLDSYRTIKLELKAILNYGVDIIDWMRNIDYDNTYTEKIQKIFHMVKLVEYSDTNTQILLLCQILEIMGINSDKSEEAKKIIENLKQIINNSEISDSEKDSLNSGLEGLKRESSGKKIKNLLKKYCFNDYKSFNKYKLVKDYYKLRSLIIHGKIIEKTDDALNKARKLKIVVLDTFKEWIKDNK